MKKRSLKIWAGAVLICFTLNSIALPAQGMASPGVNLPGAGEIHVSVPFQLELPSNLGKIETILSGSGPSVIHIQEAHGSYETQQKILKILQYLKKQYGIKQVFLEGTSFKLHKDRVHLFPQDSRRTMKALDRLAQKSLASAPELFLAQTPQAEVYGIEDLESYVENSRAFVSVLRQKEKTEKFIQDMDIQMKNLGASYLNQELRSFLERMEEYEFQKISINDWMEYLKSQAGKKLSLDLSSPGHQKEWPMFLRIFTLKKLESEWSKAAFEKEREAFLEALSRFIPKSRESGSLYAQIENRLSGDLSHQQLPHPETSLLFERMAAKLPLDFNYPLFPNVNRFIGHLILQSELDGAGLVDEMDRLAADVTDHLAKSDQEKKIIQIFKKRRLLKRLFALRLTPADYEQIKTSGAQELTPSHLVRELLEVNTAKRVKEAVFEHLSEIDMLHRTAKEFYRLAKVRDGDMLKNIEARFLGAGDLRAVVITGGFHARPFTEYFKKQGYNYALVTPQITKTGGHESYADLFLNYFSDPAENKSSLKDIPYVATAPAEMIQLGRDPEAVELVISAVLGPEDEKARNEMRSAIPGVRSEARKVKPVTLNGKRYSFESQPQGEMAVSITDPKTQDFGFPAGKQVQRYLNLYRFMMRVLGDDPPSFLPDLRPGQKEALITALDMSKRSLGTAPFDQLWNSMPRLERGAVDLIVGSFFTDAELELSKRPDNGLPKAEKTKKSIIGTANYYLKLFTIRFLKDPQFRQAADDYLRSQRGQWQNPELAKRFVPMQLSVILNMMSNGSEGVAVPEKEIDSLLQLLRTQPILTKRLLFHESSGRWAKDLQSLLPDIPGIERYVLKASFSPDLPDVRFHKLFEPADIRRFEKIGMIQEGGASVSGVSETPFIIFSDAIPQTALQDFKRAAVQLPGYENLKVYVFPAGYIPFQAEEELLFLANDHIDTVMSFWPASFFQDGQPVLWMDPYYHRELEMRSDTEWRRFLEEQKVRIVDIHPDEVKYAPANVLQAGPEMIFTNYAPRSIAALNLKPHAKVFSIPTAEAAFQTIHCMGGSLGCLGLVEPVTADNIAQYPLRQGPAVMRNETGYERALQSQGGKSWNLKVGDVLLSPDQSQRMQVVAIAEDGLSFDTRMVLQDGGLDSFTHTIIRPFYTPFFQAFPGRAENRNDEERIVTGRPDISTNRTGTSPERLDEAYPVLGRILGLATKGFEDRLPKDAVFYDVGMGSGVVGHRPGGTPYKQQGGYPGGFTIPRFAKHLTEQGVQKITAVGTDIEDWIVKEAEFVMPITLQETFGNQPIPESFKFLSAQSDFYGGIIPGQGEMPLADLMIAANVIRNFQMDAEQKRHVIDGMRRHLAPRGVLVVMRNADIEEIYFRTGDPILIGPREDPVAKLKAFLASERSFALPGGNEEKSRREAAKSPMKLKPREDQFVHVSIHSSEYPGAAQEVESLIKGLRENGKLHPDAIIVTDLKRFAIAPEVTKGLKKLESQKKIRFVMEGAYLNDCCQTAVETILAYVKSHPEKQIEIHYPADLISHPHDYTGQSDPDEKIAELKLKLGLSAEEIPHQVYVNGLAVGNDILRRPAIPEEGVRLRFYLWSSSEGMLSAQRDEQRTSEARGIFNYFKNILTDPIRGPLSVKQKGMVALWAGAGFYLLTLASIILSALFFHGVLPAPERALPVFSSKWFYVNTVMLSFITVEELLFRVFAFDALKKIMSSNKANFWQAVLFAGIHIPKWGAILLPAAPGVFAVRLAVTVLQGMGLGEITRRWGWSTAYLTHAVTNLLFAFIVSGSAGMWLLFIPLTVAVKFSTDWLIEMPEFSNPSLWRQNQNKRAEARTFLLDGREENLPASLSGASQEAMMLAADFIKALKAANVLSPNSPVSLYVNGNLAKPEENFRLLGDRIEVKTQRYLANEAVLGQLSGTLRDAAKILTDDDEMRDLLFTAQILANGVKIEIENPGDSEHKMTFTIKENRWKEYGVFKTDYQFLAVDNLAAKDSFSVSSPVNLPERFLREVGKSFKAEKKKAYWREWLSIRRAENRSETVEHLTGQPAEGTPRAEMEGASDSGTPRYPKMTPQLSLSQAALADFPLQHELSDELFTAEEKRSIETELQNLIGVYPQLSENAKKALLDPTLLLVLLGMKPSYQNHRRTLRKEADPKVLFDELKTKEAFQSNFKFGVNSDWLFNFSILIPKLYEAGEYLAQMGLMTPEQEEDLGRIKVVFRGKASDPDVFIAFGNLVQSILAEAARFPDLFTITEGIFMGYLPEDIQWIHEQWPAIVRASREAEAKAARSGEPFIGAQHALVSRYDTVRIVTEGNPASLKFLRRWVAVLDYAYLQFIERDHRTKAIVKSYLSPAYFGTQFFHELWSEHSEGGTAVRTEKSRDAGGERKKRPEMRILELLEKFVLGVSILNHGGPLNLVDPAMIFSTENRQTALTDGMGFSEETRRRLMAQLEKLSESISSEFYNFFDGHAQVWEREYRRKGVLPELQWVEEVIEKYEAWLQVSKAVFKEILENAQEIPAETKTEKWKTIERFVLRNIQINLDAIRAFVGDPVDENLSEVIELNTWLKERYWETKTQERKVSLKLDEENYLRFDPENPKIPLTLKTYPALLHVTVERLISNGVHALAHAETLAENQKTVTIQTRLNEAGAAQILISNPGTLSEDDLKMNADRGIQEIFVLKSPRRSFSGGIGLPFTSQAIQKLGGTLRAENTIENNVPKVRFTVTLPLRTEARDWFKNTFNPEAGGAMFEMILPAVTARNEQRNLGIFSGEIAAEKMLQRISEFWALGTVFGQGFLEQLTSEGNFAFPPIPMYGIKGRRFLDFENAERHQSVFIDEEGSEGVPAVFISEALLEEIYIDRSLLLPLQHRLNQLPGINYEPIDSEALRTAEVKLKQVLQRHVEEELQGKPYRPRLNFPLFLFLVTFCTALIVPFVAVYYLAQVLFSAAAIYFNVTAVLLNKIIFFVLGHTALQNLSSRLLGHRLDYYLWRYKSFLHALSIPQEQSALKLQQERDKKLKRIQTIENGGAGTSDPDTVHEMYEFLEKALFDAHGFVRQAAARALGKLSPASWTINDLRLVSKYDTHRPVRIAAEEALRHLTGRRPVGEVERGVIDIKQQRRSEERVVKREVFPWQTRPVSAEEGVRRLHLHNSPAAISAAEAKLLDLIEALIQDTGRALLVNAGELTDIEKQAAGSYVLGFQNSKSALMGTDFFSGYRYHTVHGHLIRNNRDFVVKKYLTSEGRQDLNDAIHLTEKLIRGEWLSDSAQNQAVEDAANAFEAVFFHRLISDFTEAMVFSGELIFMDTGRAKLGELKEEIAYLLKGYQFADSIPSESEEVPPPHLTKTLDFFFPASGFVKDAFENYGIYSPHLRVQVLEKIQKLVELSTGTGRRPVGEDKRRRTEMRTQVSEQTFLSGPSKVVFLEVDPASNGIHVAVNENLQGRFSIDRDTGTFNYRRDDGSIATRPDEIMRHIESDEQMLRRFEDEHPGLSVFAAVDNASLFSNQGFVTFTNGKLFHTVGENFENRVYTSLVIWKHPQVTMEEVRYKRDSGGNIEVWIGGRNVTSRINDATFGQFLLDGHGQARTDFETIIPQFQDLRHVYRFPKVRVTDLENLPPLPLVSQPEIFYGISQLAANGYGLAKQAWTSPVTLEMAAQIRVQLPEGATEPRTVQIPEPVLSTALISAGYQEVPGQVSSQGQFKFENGKLQIFFKPGVYPRTLVGVTAEQKLKILGIGGKSGSQGSTLKESAEFAAANGFQQVMLLDHGGSAKVFAEGGYLQPSSEGRYRRTSALIVTTGRRPVGEVEQAAKGVRGEMRAKGVSDSDAFFADIEREAARMGVLIEAKKKESVREYWKRIQGDLHAVVHSMRKKEGGESPSKSFQAMVIAAVKFLNIFFLGVSIPHVDEPQTDSEGRLQKISVYLRYQWHFPGIFISMPLLLFLIAPSAAISFFLIGSFGNILFLMLSTSSAEWLGWVMKAHEYTHVYQMLVLEKLRREKNPEIPFDFIWKNIPYELLESAVLQKIGNKAPSPEILSGIRRSLEDHFESIAPPRSEMRSLETEVAEKRNAPLAFDFSAWLEKVAQDRALNEKKIKTYLEELKPQFSMGGDSIARRIISGITDIPPTKYGREEFLFLELLQTAAFYILDQELENPEKQLRLDGVFESLEELIQRYNRSYPDLPQMSVSLAMILPLSLFFQKSEVDYFIKYRSRLHLLPGKYGIDAAAFDLVLTGMHLRSNTGRRPVGEVKRGRRPEMRLEDKDKRVKASQPEPGKRLWVPKRILIFENTQTMLNKVFLALQQQGAASSENTDVYTSVEAFEAADSSVSYDLIVVDNHLDGKKTGSSILKGLRQRYPKAVIVLNTKDRHILEAYDRGELPEADYSVEEKSKWDIAALTHYREIARIAAKRSELKIAESPRGLNPDAIKNVARYFTGFLVLISVKETYGDKVFEDLVRELAKENGFETSAEAELPPAIVEFLNSENGNLLRRLFDPERAQQEPERVIHLRNTDKILAEGIAAIGIEILYAALNTKTDYVLIAENRESADRLLTAARDYARQKFQLKLGANFKVIPSVNGDFISAVKTQIRKDVETVIIADGEENAGLRNGLEQLPIFEGAKIIRLVDDAHLTGAQELLLGAELLKATNEQIARMVQLASKHMGGRFSGLMIQAQAFAKFLQAA